MNWRLIAILISLLPLLFLFIFSPVSITDIFSVGLFPFIISVIFSLTKVFLQAFRFKYFVDQFLGYKVASSFKLISVRTGSEFVTNTTPSYIGGEIVRIAWLTKNKVPAGIAAWIATMEIIADVFQVLNMNNFLLLMCAASPALIGIASSAVYESDGTCIIIISSGGGGDIAIWQHW